MKTATTWALVVTVVMFCSAGIASAVKPAEPEKKPFLHVTTTPDEIDLGTALFTMGPLELKSALTVQVETNCPHGAIYLSATPLNHNSGGTIGNDRISVRTSETNGYVSMSKPVAISKPTAGSHKVVVDVKVDAPVGVTAGEYNGFFTCMITPPV